MLVLMMKVPFCGGISAINMEEASLSYALSACGILL